ncbi:glycosyltransferase family 2 protein [Vampirovibrio chlorellavorus]|uniref:glycosyltransferase family 2 protein n=1 Tax=Vampirovibrio chlorellavorus TaxID=758823 RepID=UPI0026F19439|nr:glycosyltransferase [Vampirovibrio chlorellavorus]
MTIVPHPASPPTTPEQALPLVSIIMPTHNAAAYIGQSIQSVLNQTYPNWELLIADDASTDETGHIVASFNDVRIHYQKLARVGHPAGVRNAALRHAKGELIAFLDSDDLYYPDTLAKLSTPLLNNPNLISAYGFADQIDHQGNPLPNPIQLVEAPPEKSGPEQPAQPHRYPASHYAHSWDRIVTSQISCLLAGLMIRRSAWEQIGYFNETLCGPEDYEFYVRMFLHNHAGVLCLNDYVYQYRIHAASLTKAPEHYEKLLSSCLKIMHWMFTEAPIPAEVRPLKSKAYLGCYRYLARERLLQHQPHIARKLALKTFREPNIKLGDALLGCGPLLIRSFLPTGLDDLLVSLRRQARLWKSRLKTSPISPLSAGSP